MDSIATTARREVVVFECTPALTKEGLKQTEQLPFAIRKVRVPCSGKLQPEHLLKAFEAGADLVVVLTCPNGECRYLEGRRRIERRVEYVRGLLDEIGIGGKRLLLLDRPDDASISDGWRALAEADDLAPSPLGANSEVKG